MPPAERFVRDRHFAYDLTLCALVTVLALGYTLLVGETGPRPRLAGHHAAAARAADVPGGRAGGDDGRLPASPWPSARCRPPPGIISVPVLVYTLARWSGRTLARLAWAVAAVGSFLGPARWALRGAGLGDLTIFTVSVVACFAVVSAAHVVGRKLRESEDSASRQERSEAERVRLLSREQESRLGRVEGTDATGSPASCTTSSRTRCR